MGRTLPVEVAGVNTAILVSSSFTLHWAEAAIKKGNRFGLKAGILTTFLLGCAFLFIQINEYANIGFAPQDHAQATIFYSLTGLHGAHVLIGLVLLSDRHDQSIPRPLLARAAPRRGGARDLLALRGHHVDSRLHHRLRHLRVMDAAHSGVLGRLCAEHTARGGWAFNSMDCLVHDPQRLAVKPLRSC